MCGGVIRGRGYKGGRWEGELGMWGVGDVGRWEGGKVWRWGGGNVSEEVGRREGGEGS